MNLNQFINDFMKSVKGNSPEILTALGISGVLTTSYLFGKASYKASEVIHEEEDRLGTSDDRKQRLKDRTALVWKLYIPAGISGALTIGCIVGSSRANSRRTAAAVTAYSLTERAFTEYREKVVEQIGKGKEQKLRDELVQDRVLKKPSTEVVVLGNGHVLCCEMYTHRYFRSDMETLRKAQNDLNAKIINDLYVTLNEFYDLLGLDYTTNSFAVGWDSNKMMELIFSTVLSADGEPCLAFEYNYIKPLR